MNNPIAQLLPASRPAGTLALRPAGSTLDHGGIDALSARHSALLARLGVAAGDRVAVQAPKGV
jgi:hypothetical protein